jgi:hypothetical protein
MFHRKNAFLNDGNFEEQKSNADASKIGKHPQGFNTIRLFYVYLLLIVKCKNVRGLLPFKEMEEERAVVSRWLD